MVPLFEQDHEIGYITVGAIEDGYATYEINIQPYQTVNDIRSKMREKMGDLKSGKVEVVYIPPFDYLIKVSDKKGNVNYFDLANNHQDVTEKVRQKKGGARGGLLAHS